MKYIRLIFQNLKKNISCTIKNLPWLRIRVFFFFKVTVDKSLFVVSLTRYIFRYIVNQSRRYRRWIISNRDKIRANDILASILKISFHFISITSSVYISSRSWMQEQMLLLLLHKWLLPWMSADQNKFTFSASFYSLL